MIEFVVNKAIEDVKREHRNLSKQEVNRAISRTINSILTTGRKESAQIVANIYKEMKVGAIKNRMKLNKSTSSTLVGSLVNQEAPTPLFGFKHTKTKRGVRVMLKGKRKDFPGVFKAKMKSGRVGLFARGKYENNRFKTRRKRIKPTGLNDLPIGEMFSYALPSILARNDVQQNLNKLVTEKFGEKLDKELKYRSLKAAGLS